MKRNISVIPFPNLCVLCVLCANPFHARESTRAKLKGIKPDEMARTAVEWAFALYKELDDQGAAQ